MIASRVDLTEVAPTLTNQQQGDDDRTDGHHHGAVGLGLAVVRAIAIAHGGDVEMESTPGAGSTVRMTLPTIQDRFIVVRR
ncbi:MAG: ATP-binding protein [Ilumatobacteraceae bacterium]